MTSQMQATADTTIRPVVEVALPLKRRVVTEVPTQPSKQTCLDRLYMMKLIRRFEDRCFVEYSRPGQRIGGFCHLANGQEAINVGLASVFRKPIDMLFAGYRHHGFSLAFGMSPRTAFAELFGRVDGCCKGNGGSIHFFDSANGNHGGYTIVGAQMAIALGGAFAARYKNTGGVAWAVLGDGAVNCGYFHESMNMAALWKLPIVFLVENNKYAMGMSVERSCGEPDLVRRGEGNGIPCVGFDATDLDITIKHLSDAAERARNGYGPTYLVANAERFRGHSMSDPQKYRTREQIECAKRRDPLHIYERRLVQLEIATQQDVDALDDPISDILDDAVRFADQSPNPPLEQRFENIHSETYPFLPS